jgi:hypothetical protein
MPDSDIRTETVIEFVSLNFRTVIILLLPDVGSDVLAASFEECFTTASAQYILVPSLPA